MFEGRVVVWNSPDEGSIGDSHGRRDSGAVSDQWQVGDYVEIISLDNLCTEKPCTGSLPNIANVDVNSVRDCSDLLHNQICSYECAQGYTKSGESTCMLGTFRGGSCVENSCLENPNIEYMDQDETTCQNTEPFGECDVVCKFGYSRSTGTTTCRLGSWQVNTQCNANACMSPLVLENAMQDQCIGTQHGSRCDVVCESGYDFISTQGVKCSLGSFEVGVNVNTASTSELETLYGIGPATAAKIVEYRTIHVRYICL